MHGIRHELSVFFTIEFVSFVATEAEATQRSSFLPGRSHAMLLVPAGGDKERCLLIQFSQSSMNKRTQKEIRF